MEARRLFRLAPDVILQMPPNRFHWAPRKSCAARRRKRASIARQVFHFRAIRRFSHWHAPCLEWFATNGQHKCVVPRQWKI